MAMGKQYHPEKRAPYTRGGYQGPCQGDCGRMLRPAGVPRVEYPGTVVAAARQRCSACYKELVDAERHEAERIAAGRVGDQMAWRSEFDSDEKAVLVLLGNHLRHDTGFYEVAEALGLRTIDGVTPHKIGAYSPIMR